MEGVNSVGLTVTQWTVFCMLFVGKGTELEIMTVSGISQTQRIKHHIFLVIGGIQSEREHESRRQTTRGEEEG